MWFGLVFLQTVADSFPQCQTKSKVPHAGSCRIDGADNERTGFCYSQNSCRADNRRKKKYLSIKWCGHFISQHIGQVKFFQLDGKWRSPDHLKRERCQGRLQAMGARSSPTRVDLNYFRTTTPKKILISFSTSKEKRVFVVVVVVVVRIFVCTIPSDLLIYFFLVHLWTRNGDERERLVWIISPFSFVFLFFTPPRV